MNRVVATWSGGIDSTAVIANLLFRGMDVEAVTLEFGPEKFVEREREARATLLPHLEALDGTLVCTTEPGDWLWKFSPDGIEIPQRNKRIIDRLIAAHCMPAGIKNIGMGEYIGVDTWVVRDHVGGADCDARSLAAYIYEQYGIEYRLFTLADFGESRYKSQRLQLGVNILGEAMWATTNCLNDGELHCGECYKCLERAAAFKTIEFPDGTHYRKQPHFDPRYEVYLHQMQGVDVQLPWEVFNPAPLVNEFA